MTKSHCDTCENGIPNPANFGSLCDGCEAARRERTARTAATLRAFGQGNSDLGRALRTR